MNAESHNQPSMDDATGVGDKKLAIKTRNVDNRTFGKMSISILYSSFNVKAIWWDSLIIKPN